MKKVAARAYGYRRVAIDVTATLGTKGYLEAWQLQAVGRLSDCGHQSCGHQSCRQPPSASGGKHHALFRRDPTRDFSGLWEGSGAPSSIR